MLFVQVPDGTQMGSDWAKDDAVQSHAVHKVGYLTSAVRRGEHHDATQLSRPPLLDEGSRYEPAERMRYDVKRTAQRIFESGDLSFQVINDR
jgi:hypothetical protein